MTVEVGPGTVGAVPGDRWLRVFDTLAFLFAPADAPERARVVLADFGWRTPAARPGDVVVTLWGRPPDHDRPRLSYLPGALRRELALARLGLRPRDADRSVRVNRLPPSPRAGRVQRFVRTALDSGAVIELVPHAALDPGPGGARQKAPTRVIDKVVRAAGGRSDRLRIRPSGDGSALIRLVLADGQPAELRVGRLGRARHPGRGLEALRALERHGVSLVPRPLGGGEVAGVAWTTESVLGGHVAGRLTPALMGDIVRFGAALRSPGRPQSIGDNLAVIARWFPRHGELLNRVARASDTWAADLPAAILHGDLWLGNLLVAGGRLSGVVDWDTWHPAGLVGTDLLTVISMEERRRGRRDIGPLWSEGIWRSAAFEDAARPYWRALGVPAPTLPGLAAIGLDWWAGAVVGAGRRARRPWDDPAWVARNVDDVVEGLEGLLRDVGEE